MRKQSYVVSLTEEERSLLLGIIAKGSGPAQRIQNAHILLAADQTHGGLTDNVIAKQYHVHVNTVAFVRKKFAEHGLEVALNRKIRQTPPITPKIDGDVEAQLIALSCSAPPEGRSQWTLRLLANKMVELEIIDAISYESVRRVLKKTN